MKPILIAIVGPTASGKSSLSIFLARKFNGEIVSADSRQVYKHLDIGTGKVSKKEQRQVVHHLLNIASPKKTYTVSDFKQAASRAINQIHKKNKIPFLVGGTPFYIYTLLDDLQIPVVKPDKKLRARLAKKSAAELYSMLKKLDPVRARTIDRQNPARLIRAIEIVKLTGKPVPANPFLHKNQPYETLLIGINKSPTELKKLIHSRLVLRLRQGLIAEVKKLLKSGVTHRRLFELGLEYRFVSEHLKHKLTKKQLLDQLSQAIYRFSKRQITWFGQDSRIHWVKSPAAAAKLVQKFLKSNKLA